MIKVEWLYWLVGLVFVVMAVQMAADRTNPKRWTSAAFWGLLGLTFPYGTGVATVEPGTAAWRLPAEPLGVAVLALIVLAGFNFLGKGVPVTTTAEQREASAVRLGSKIFIPALTIPFVAIVCASEPLIGSVRPKQPSFLPEAQAVSTSFFWASVPNL